MNRFAIAADSSPGPVASRVDRNAMRPETGDATGAVIASGVAVGAFLGAVVGATASLDVGIRVGSGFPQAIARTVRAIRTPERAHAPFM